MPERQARSLQLTTREETRRLLASVVDGHRDSLPTAPAQLTRYVQGSCANPLEVVALMIRLLPEGRAAQVMSYLEDTYEDAHGHSHPDFEEAMRAEAEADAAEDVVQLRVALGCRASRSELLNRSRAQEAAGRRLRRAVMAMERKPAKRAGWAAKSRVTA